jgi:transporter family protein
MQFVSAFGFLFVAVAVFPVKKVELRGSWRGGRFALISGVLLGVGGMALYGAYRASHNSSVVTAVTSLYPVITVLLAVSFLREKINRLQTLGILFAAIAILLLCHWRETMYSSTWLLCFVVLLSWGALGIFHKLAMNYVSAETALLWAAAGCLVFQVTLFPGKSIFAYSSSSLGWALLNGLFNGLGLLTLMSAMRSGGKASIVEPLSAL